MRARTAFAGLSALLALSFAVWPAAAVAAVDAVTGLPLYPGAGVPDKTLDIPECGIAVRASTYDLLPGRDATAVAWFVAHLPGYVHVHVVKIGHDQDTFIARDGGLGAAVTGNRDGSLYGVSYARFKPHLSAAQREKFGAQLTPC